MDNSENPENLIHQHPLVNTLLTKLNITSLSSIQSKSIPHFLNPSSPSSPHPQLTTINSCAGSGKTLSYLIPLLSSLSFTTPRKLQALILLPTRELSIQTADYFHLLSDCTPHISYSLHIGGTANLPGKRTYTKLTSSTIPHIVIGTLGKLSSVFHHSKILQHISTYSNFTYIIIDEADKLIHQNHNNSLKNFLSFLYAKLCNNSHIILCSASFTQSDISFYTNIFTSLSSITHISSHDSAQHIIEYCVLFSPVKSSTYYEQKSSAVIYLLSQLQHSFNQCIVFYNHKGKGEELSNELRNLNFSVVFIHGDLSQDQRQLIYQQIKRMNTKIVISTDLLSRGIDLNAVDLVINFDMPYADTDYAHRVGRTGRFFTKGIALSFIQEDEKNKTDLHANEANIISHIDEAFILKMKNDFAHMKKDNVRIKEEDIKHMEALPMGINVSETDVKLLQAKRRRHKYETQSIVHEWQEITTEHTQYEHSHFCLYCNLFKLLDI